MVALKVVNKVFFIVLSVCTFGDSYKNKNSFPSIHDVVSFKRTEPPDNDQVDLESELTIDIEKLDFHRIKKDDTAFRKQLMGDIGEDLLEEPNKNNTRRIPYYPDYPQEYFKAYELQFRTKMADVMLQLIYMARSKIKNFHAQGHVSTTSSGYRMGFIIRKLDDLVFRARRYYITMVEKQNNGKWNTESTSILNIHHKVVMMHHDFMRLFYVQMTLHERYQMMEGKSIHEIDVETTTR